MKVVNFHLPDDTEDIEEKLRSLFPNLENITVEDVTAQYHYNYSSHPAFRAGYDAGFCAMGPKQNPYDRGSEFYLMWEDGWAVGQEET